MNVRPDRRASVLAVAVGLFGVIGAARSAEQVDDSGFLNPRDEIIAAIKTIGVMPLAVDDAVPDAGRVTEHYESEVVARLEKAGFAVVKPAAMRAIRERLLQSLGGVYDPVTGRPQADKLKALREFEASEYLETVKIDATLWIGIVERRAKASNTSADWDGVRDRSTGLPGFGGGLAGLSSDPFVGTLRALSFEVELRDAYGKVLYNRYGGLQPLEYIPMSVGRGKSVRGEPVSILAEPARDQRAIALALDPLTLGAASAAEATSRLSPVERQADNLPVRVPLRQFRKRYHTIAIAPLELPWIPQRTDTDGQFRELLAARLRQLGFAVAGEASYAERWVAEVTAAGGFYDRNTGRLDRERFAGARRRMFTALREEFGIDAVLQPSVKMRTAVFRYLIADWDGADESIASGTGVSKGFLDPNGDYMGTLPALSLFVRITNGEDETVYEDVGGIQLAGRVDHGYVVDLPEARLLTDKNRNEAAVHLALHALVPPPQ